MYDQTETFNSNHHRCQTHVHEFEGSVKIAEIADDPHNHRFAGETGQAIFCNGSHYHKLETRTDFYENHFHYIIDRTGLAKDVGNGKHVHLVKGQTTFNDGHKHCDIFATLIEDPIGD